MNTFKKLNSKTLRFTKEINGEQVSQILKGVMIGDIPNSFGEYGTHWFNYKGLTYLIK
jgi:hypothetical protein